MTRASLASLDFLGHSAWLAAATIFDCHFALFYR
jgi:hypothetical protein